MNGLAQRASVTPEALAKGFGARPYGPGATPAPDDRGRGTRGAASGKQKMLTGKGEGK